MRIRLTSCLLVLTACAPDGNVRLDLGSLRSSAALTGVPLDRIEVRASAPDFGEVSVAISADEDTVSLQVSPGPERLFELEAVRTLDDGTEVVAYAGETTQTIVAGANEVLLRYREQGLLQITPEVVGDDVIPEGAFLVLVDERGRTTKVEFDAPTTIRATTYTVAGSGLGALRAPDSTLIPVSVGERTLISLPLFRSSTQCLPDSPPEVRADGAGCATVELSVAGLALPEVEILVNGVPLVVNRDGSFFAENGVPVGEPFNVTVQAPGGNPKQECEIINGSGVGGASEPVTINCGPVLYRVDFQPSGDVGTGLVLAVAESESSAEPNTIPITGTDVLETDLFFQADGSLGFASIFVDQQPNDPTIRCVVADDFVVDDGVVPPLRVICMREAQLVYSDRDSVGDFIQNDGPNLFSAQNVPCPSDATGFDRCFDASAVRQLTVPGSSDCSEVFIEDFSILDWTCDDSTGTVELRSVGWKSLALAIDTSQGSARIPISVRVGTSSPVQFDPAPLGNPVVNADAVGTPLTQEGTIYYTTEFASAGGRTLGADRVILVATSSFSPLNSFAGATVTVNGAFNTVSGFFQNNSTSVANTVQVNGTARFATITGELSSFVGNCISVGAESATVRWAVANNCGNDGIQMTQPYGTVEHSRVTNVGNIGINLDIAGATRVFDTTVDRVQEGIVFNGEGTGNIWIDGVRISETSFAGIDFSAARAVHISNTLIVGTEGNALRLTTDNSLIRHVTFANGNSNGLGLNFANTVRAEGVLSAGYFTNLSIGESSDISLRDVVLTDSLSNRVSSLNSNNVEFEGQLVLETGSCSEIDGSNVGFATPDCVDPAGDLPAPSTATATERSAGLEGTFVGRVSDIENFSGDFLGNPVPFGNITDWSRFESRSRAWRDTSGFGTTRCFLNCEIYDFTPNASSPAVGLAPPPDSLPTYRMVWGSGASVDDCSLLFDGSVFDSDQGECFNEYLVSADEVSGNGNGLCESDETCVYRPDAGAFAAGGPPYTPQSVSSGNVSNVTLLVPTSP